MSFRDDWDGPVVREAAGRFLAGWLPAGLVGDTLAVIDEVVGDALRHARGGELVLSRRDDTVLVEVAGRDRPAGESHLPTVSARARAWGTYPLADGRVLWVEMPEPVGCCSPGRSAGCDHR